MRSVLAAELYHNPADSTTKARALSALKTQYHEIVRTGEYGIGEHRTGKYGTDKYKHLPILERVANVAM